MELFVQFIYGVLLLIVGGAVTALAQWAVPRIRKTREVAETAKTTAEEAVSWMTFYKEQITLCQDQIKDLQLQVAELREEIHDWKTAVAEEAPEDVRERIERNVRQKAFKRKRSEN